MTTNNTSFRRIFIVALFMSTLSKSSIDAFRPPENPVMNVKLPILSTNKSPSSSSPPLPRRVGGDVNRVQAEEQGCSAVTVDARLLSQVGRAVAESRDSTFYARTRKRWGIDHAEDGEYWFDTRIHTFGNIGFWGAFHAALAPISTKIIDMVAYDGEDVRAKVALDLSQKLAKRSKLAGAKVLDMCCGVGISTRALRDAFPDADKVIGLDTSKEMISMANFLTTHLGFFKPIIVFFQSGLTKPQQVCNGHTSFAISNAERTDFEDHSFDLVTVMYAFHEAPKVGRERILREAYRVLQPGGTLAVVDIDTNYTPSDTMLAGEPYVIEYQRNIHRQLKTMKGFTNVKYETVVPNHVGMWILTRTAI